MRLNAKQIAHCTGGEFLVEPIDGAALFEGVTWDSRDVHEGDLYIALPGERTDGHNFIEAALRSGAAGALVSEPPEEKVCRLARELGAPIIEVPNTFHAVSDLAREWRRHITAKVVGVTGSVGKTTTKNLIRDVCASSYSTCATRANQNNELGVPATVLSADPDTQVLIVEMGMRGSGQIAELCEMVRPDWGVVTNVGECHIELLGSIENVAAAKAELFDALPSGTGRAFIPAASKFEDFLAGHACSGRRNVSCIEFGTREDGMHAEGDERFQARIWAEDVQMDAEGRPSFTLCAHGFAKSPGSPSEPTLFDMEPDTERAACKLALRGLHNVQNACAAAAVGRSLGMTLDECAEALASSVPEAGRQEVSRSRAGFTVVNDAYNANPDSMRASIAMLSSMRSLGKRVAVLGDMAELGSEEVACHEGVGRYAAEQGVDALIAIGPLSAHMADAAQDAGMSPSQITKVRTVQAALDALDGLMEPDDVVLVKASHCMGLDEVASSLLEMQPASYGEAAARETTR